MAKNHLLIELSCIIMTSTYLFLHYPKVQLNRKCGTKLVYRTVVYRKKLVTVLIARTERALGDCIIVFFSFSSKLSSTSEC